MNKESAFVPDYLTLNEAAAHLERETGRPWSASALLGFCAQQNIPMNAAVPRDARAVQCEVTDPGALTICPVKGMPYTVKGQTYAQYRPATWRMAVAHPITIAHVWQTGRGEVAHGVPTARDHEPDMVMFVNDQHEPITHEVTADDMRVSEHTLRVIRDRWQKSRPLPLDAPAAPAPSASAPVVVEPVELPADAVTPVNGLPMSQWKVPRSNRWTKAAKDQMRAMREKYTDLQIAETFNLNSARQVGNLIGSRSANMAARKDPRKIIDGCIESSAVIGSASGHRIT